MGRYSQLLEVIALFVGPDSQGREQTGNDDLLDEKRGYLPPGHGVPPVYGLVVNEERGVRLGQWLAVGFLVLSVCLIVASLVREVS